MTVVRCARCPVCGFADALEDIAFGELVCRACFWWVVRFLAKGPHATILEVS